eukprot:5178020-Pleurochrysis_carterae.AAC.1
MTESPFCAPKPCPDRARCAPALFRSLPRVLKATASRAVLLSREHSWMSRRLFSRVCSCSPSPA